MNFEAMPILRFEIDRIQNSINTCLGAHGSELGDAIAEAVRKAVECYDLEGEVERIVYNQIGYEIEWYFKYGDGNKAIRKFICSAFGQSDDRKECGYGKADNE